MTSPHPKKKKVAQHARAAADQPMQIISTSYNKATNIITVTWQAVSYSGLDGYIVSIMQVGHRQDNYPQGDPTAISAAINYTEEAGQSYQTFVEPSINGTPQPKLMSPIVAIPYP